MMKVDVSSRNAYFNRKIQMKSNLARTCMALGINDNKLSVLLLVAQFVTQHYISVTLVRCVTIDTHTWRKRFLFEIPVTYSNYKLFCSAIFRLFYSNHSGVSSLLLLHAMFATLFLLNQWKFGDNGIWRFDNLHWHSIEYEFSSYSGVCRSIFDT